MLTFSFSGVEGTMVQPELLTSGMVGKEVKFLFSPEWEGLSKTAVYTAGSRTVIRTGLKSLDTIPAEVLEKPLETLWVGVYGVSPDKKIVIPTIRAEGPRILPGADPWADPAAEPSLPVWAQILQLIGDPEQLLTEQKESLVAAINELFRTGGGGQEDGETQPPESGACGCENEASPFAGRKASFYGDSLTEENFQYTKGYHQWVQELLELESYSNYGKSGYKVSDVYTKVSAVTDTAELVVVMCGVNDQNYSVPLGTLGDTSTATTYGALWLLCEKLKEKYPTSIVVFMTPHFQTKYPHSAGITSADISRAVREVCARFAIPVYDNFALSGICSTNLDMYTNDNCHWNDLAHEMVGRNLAKYLRGTFAYVPGAQEVPEVTLTGIEAVFSQGSAAIYEGSSLDVLEEYLTVTALYSDGSTAEVTDYTLSGSLVQGSCLINVSWGGMMDSFPVMVSLPEDGEVTLSALEVAFDSGDTVIYDSTSLEDLRAYLTVTARYSSGSWETVTDYTLSGTLQPGTCTIGASWGGLSTYINVEVVQTPVTLDAITVIFNQGDAVIYETDALDTLRQYLTVTATYSDGSFEEVTDYTLSGALEEGSSSITVSYGGILAGFSVTVTGVPDVVYQVEITGAKISGSFHLSLYVTAEALPQVTEGIVTYGFDLEPLTEFTVTPKETGGIYLVDQVNNLAAGYTELGNSGMTPTVTDNGDGTYSISGKQPHNGTTLTQTAARAYWCLPINTSNPVGSKFNLINPWVKVGSVSYPIHAIGGAFDTETCIVT